MAALVGTPTVVEAETTTYTAESGSNRIVVLTITSEEFFTPTFSPVMGAQAFTSGATAEDNNVTDAAMFYILEADIPSGSQSIDIDPDVTLDGARICLLTLEDCDQSAPTFTTLGHENQTTHTVNLTGVADGIAVGVMNVNNALNIFNDANWTEIDNTTLAGNIYRNLAAYKSTTAGADTYEVTSNASSDAAGVVGVFSNNATDTTAPVLTSPTAGSLTTDGVTPSVTTDEGNGTLYWGIYADASSPTAAQVVAGTSAILSGSQAVSSTGSQAVSAQTGLADATSYELFFVHDDAAANRSNLSTVGFTTSTDSTAPSLTSPTAGSVTSTSVAPTVTTNTAEGTAYARVYANGATPTNSQVQSGTGVTPVASATNITVGASGALNFSAITGLTEGTDYELYFVHVDAATTPNLSAVSTVGFTTTAAARSVELTGANGYELRDETGAVIASLNGIIWEWYDDPDSTAGSPTDSGTFNTSAGGEATITITGSSLADGAFGTLWVRHPTDDEIRGNYYLPITVS